MDKLPSTVRRALIEKASTASAALFTNSNKKIPLQFLANLNKNSTNTLSSTQSSPANTPLLRLDTLLLSMTNTSSDTNAPVIEKNEKIDDHSNGNRRGGGTSNNIPKTNTNTESRVAEVLLHEVQLRLAKQHQKCLDIIDSVSSSYDRPKHRELTSSSSSSSVKRKVIKAVNQPVSYYGNGNNISNTATIWSETVKMIENDRKDTIKELNNLEILHADTFALTHHLLSNDKPTLTRFSPADRKTLAATFEQIRSRHAATVETLADIVINLRNIEHQQPQHNTTTTTTTTTNLIDSFLHDRLSVQFLCDHYVGLHHGKPHGAVHTNCDILAVVNDAVIEAKSVCDANLGVAPEVQVVPPVGEGEGMCGVTMVRPYVHHALVELLKNAMASSIERAVRDQGWDGEGSLPTPPDVCVRVIVDDGGDGGGVVMCDVIDRGIGLGTLDTRHCTDDDTDDDTDITTAFKFTHSSSPQRWDRIDEQQSYASVRAPLGSLGVGLTSSRMMMQMFGGDVMLWGNDDSSRGNSGIGVSGTASTHRTGDDDDGVEEKVGVIDSGCTARLVLQRDPSWWTGEYWKS